MVLTNEITASQENKVLRAYSRELPRRMAHEQEQHAKLFESSARITHSALIKPSEGNGLTRGCGFVYPYDCWPRSPAQRSAPSVRARQRRRHQGFITVHGRAGGGADETISTSRLFEHCYATADTPSTDGMSVS